jgi:hypothetical protein
MDQQTPGQILPRKLRVACPAASAVKSRANSFRVWLPYGVARCCARMVSSVIGSGTNGDGTVYNRFASNGGITQVIIDLVNNRRRDHARLLSRCCLQHPHSASIRKRDRWRDTPGFRMPANVLDDLFNCVAYRLMRRLRIRGCSHYENVRASKFRSWGITSNLMSQLERG